MFTQHFSLKCDPFRVTPDPRFYFAARGHESTIESVIRELATPGALILLTSGPGCGKTMTLRYLLNQLRDSRPVALLSHGNLEVGDFLHSLSSGLGCEGGNNFAGTLQGLEKLAAELPPENRPVILVDEADRITTDVMSMLPHLLNAHDQAQIPLCSIVLAGGEALPLRIRGAENGPKPRISIHIPRLLPREVPDYVRFRLETAGCSSGTPLFDEAALKRITDLSECIARRINTLCDKSLLLAALDESEQVTVTMVEQAAEEAAIGAISKVSPEPAPAAEKRRPTPAGNPDAPPPTRRRHSLIDALDAAIDSGRISGSVSRKPPPRTQATPTTDEIPSPEPPPSVETFAADIVTPAPAPRTERNPQGIPTFDEEEAAEFIAAMDETIQYTPPPQQPPAQRQESESRQALHLHEPAQPTMSPAAIQPARAEPISPPVRPGTTEHGVRQRGFGLATDSMTETPPQRRHETPPPRHDGYYPPPDPMYPGEPPPGYPYEEIPRHKAPRSNSAAVVVTVAVTALISFGTYLQSPMGEGLLKRIQSAVGIPTETIIAASPQDLPEPEPEAESPPDPSLPPR